MTIFDEIWWCIVCLMQIKNTTKLIEKSHNPFFKNLFWTFYSRVGFNFAILLIESSTTEPGSPCIFKFQVLSQSCCHLTPPHRRPFRLPVITPFPFPGNGGRGGLLVPCWQMGWYLKTLWTAWLISLVGEGTEGRELCYQPLWGFPFLATTLN